RAARIAPDDRTVALALAAACLERDNARAAALFREVAHTLDVPQAWLGLAIASLNLANLEAAAAALARALSRHVGAPDGDLVAEAIAGATGAPGWCAMPRYGRIRIALRAPPRSLAATLDGKPFQLVGKRGRADLRLPPDWIAARRLTIRADGRDLLGSPLDLAAIR